MWDWLCTRSGKPSAISKRWRRPRVLLRIEALESRVVPAIDILVTTELDAVNEGSLRDAIEQANALTDNTAIIRFADHVHNIQLSSALPVLQKVDEIDGPGSGSLTIRRAPDATEAFRIFTIAGPNPITESNTVLIKGVTITGGKTPDGEGSVGDGGGVRSAATLLRLRDVVITNNTARRGGGLITWGNLEVSDSTISGNVASDSGGGIFYGGDRLEISNTKIRDNTAGRIREGLYGLEGVGDGGGVFIDNQRTGQAIFDHPEYKIENTEISGNKAYRHGGGIARHTWGGAEQANGKFTLDRCTIDGNSTVTGSGGGVWTDAGGLISQCTIDGNKSARGGAGVHIAANRLFFTPASLAAVTLTSNKEQESKYGPWTLSWEKSVPAVVAGLYIEELPVADNPVFQLTVGADLVNSVIAGNDGTDVLGRQGTGGYNFIADGSKAGNPWNQNTDKTGTAQAPLDPKLVPLADNGGPTRTRLPSQGSPLIDKGGGLGVIIRRVLCRDRSTRGGLCAPGRRSRRHRGRRGPAAAEEGQGPDVGRRERRRYPAG